MTRQTPAENKASNLDHKWPQAETKVANQELTDRTRVFFRGRWQRSRWKRREDWVRGAKERPALRNLQNQ
jgi:hypothetical protein